MRSTFISYFFISLSITNLLYPAVIKAETGEIDEVLVYGQRVEETIPLELSRYGSRLEIITAEEIEKQGYSDIGQALQRLVPGLFIAQKNGPFDYFSGSLQGSRNQDILWLIDGLRISNRLYLGV